jgi:hypothetical protein
VFEPPPPFVLPSFAVADGCLSLGRVVGSAPVRGRWWGWEGVRGEEEREGEEERGDAEASCDEELPRLSCVGPSTSMRNAR